MNKMQKARELYKLHNGCRVDVISALVRDEGMTWAGAKTYFQVISADVRWENHKRKHRWDFLKDPQTYFLPLLVIAILLLSRI